MADLYKQHPLGLKKAVSDESLLLKLLKFLKRFCSKRISFFERQCKIHVNHMLYISLHHDKFFFEKMMFSFSNSFYSTDKLLLGLFKFLSLQKQSK